MKQNLLIQELYFRFPTVSIHEMKKIAAYITKQQRHWNKLDDAFYMTTVINGIEKALKTFDADRGSLLPYVSRAIRQALSAVEEVPPTFTALGIEEDMLVTQEFS